MELSYAKVIFPAPFQSSSCNPEKSMVSVVFAFSFLYSSVRVTVGADASFVSAAYTISFCKNVHASGVSDPIIAAASVMATICFPTLLMFLLYLSFLLHFSCKNLPAPSIYPIRFHLIKKQLHAASHISGRGYCILGECSKNMGTSVQLLYLFDKFSIS